MAAADAGPPPEGEERWARLAGHPAAPALLVLSAVVEGCLFPAPTEALYAALALARPRRSWALAGLAGAGSVLGGVIAYAFGAWFLDSVGARVLDAPGLGGLPRVVGEAYRENTALALVTSGYTPVPYVVYGVTAGMLGLPLGAFLLWSAIGRGLKYALLAGIARLAAPFVRRWMQRSRAAVVLILAALLALALAAWLR
jgi:membrane protein YqaA with SNARE-associated domain